MCINSNSSNILGYEISNHGLLNDVSKAFELIKKNNKFSYMVCANPHSLIEAKNDIKFSTAISKADILLPDGTGIILAGIILGQSFKERVAGNEFFLGICEKSKKKKLKFYFLGSTEAVLRRIADRLKSEYPNIEVVGYYSPPFKIEFNETENQTMLDLINDASPDVLWVGMTAPKQEKWIYQNRDKLKVAFVGAIGAVFDFYAGTKYRAPQWVCQLGLEWLPRLIKEPGRLWRRNFISSPIFIYSVIRQKINNSTE